MVDKFIKEKELLKSWDKFRVDYIHDTEVMGKKFTYVIDDFCWNNVVEDNVIDADCPIYCHIKVDGLYTRRQETLIATNRLSWKIACHEQRTRFQLKLKIALESTNSRVL